MVGGREREELRGDSSGEEGIRWSSKWCVHVRVCFCVLARLCDLLEEFRGESGKEKGIK